VLRQSPHISASAETATTAGGWANAYVQHIGVAEDNPGVFADIALSEGGVSPSKVAKSSPLNKSGQKFSRRARSWSCARALVGRGIKPFLPLCQDCLQRGML